MLPSFLGICHVGGGGGCPPYGTIINTLLGVTYPISEGGTYVNLDPDGISGTYPNQICDVLEKADGSCGTFIDWSSVDNVSFLPYGTLLAQDSIGYSRGNGNTVYIEINCTGIGNVSASTFRYQYFSNGNDGVYSEQVDNPYFPYGSSTNLSNPYWVNGDGCDPDNPIQINIYWDGSGGYYYENA